MNAEIKAEEKMPFGYVPDCPPMTDVDIESLKRQIKDYKYGDLKPFGAYGCRCKCVGKNQYV